MRKGLILGMVASLAAGVVLAQPAPPPGAFRPEAAFQSSCAKCHENPAARAPDRATLRRISPEGVYTALTTGPMASMAVSLTDPQKRAMAEYLADRKMGSAEAAEASKMKGYCGPLAKLPAVSSMDWNGWANGSDGARYQPVAKPPGQLHLKWAFGIPGASEVYAQPTVAAGQVYVSSDAGWVYAVDPDSGCVRWSFQAEGGVRTAPIVGVIGGRALLFFGDIKSNAYAVDARTGAKVWRTLVDSHVLGRITGSPVLSQGRLYVPVSSHEEWLGAGSSYPCCTFRGILASLDAGTGRIVWKSLMIDEAAKPTRKNSQGVQLWGPAGAAIWGAPAIDEQRGLAYVSTGDGYTSPAAPTTDAVVAVSLKTGKRVWTFQAIAGDAWIGGCTPGTKAENCPDPVGPDYDFSSGVILAKGLVIAAQKSGIVWALDPDRGRPVWKADVTSGPVDARGELVWGGASDGRSVYFGLTTGGFAAVDLKDGKLRWRRKVEATREPERLHGHSGAVSLVPGAVLSGGWDGVLRAISTEDGRVLSSFDTLRDFDSVNGVPAHGGSMGAPGPTVAGGRIYVGSGIIGGSGRPGNALLAFAAD
jgi:polyvinyl alcohol dehydrogenase (cytochrome)